MFAGGCTLQTAEAVCGMTLERLGAFVDHSLLRRTVGESGSRYHMLETIREHAAEQLTADDAAHQVRRRHAEHFLAVAESANLIEDAEAAGEQHHEIVIAEQDNMRAALQWTLDTGEIEFGLQLALTLENYWVTSAPFEGMRWFEALLPLADHVPKRLHARAVRCYGGATTMTGADLNGERLYEQSLAEFRALGDEAAVGSLLQRLAESARQRGDAAHARRLAEESLQIARSTGATRVEAQSLGTLGSLTYEGGDYELGMQLLERSADLCAEIGFRWWQGLMLAFLCENALELGRTREAEAWGGEALRLLHQIGDRQNTLCLLATLARAAAETGRAEHAGRLWGAVETEEVRAPMGWWELHREQYAAPVLARADAEFEQGRLAGRALSLDEAVRYALGDQAGPSQTVTSPAAPRATT